MTSFDPTMGAGALWENGPTPGGFYQFNGPANHMDAASRTYPQDPRQHTMQPIVTGTSVLAMKCTDGIVMAADTLGSYGSMAKFRSLKRIVGVGSNTLVGGSGDMADFSAVKDMLDDVVIENDNWCDGNDILPRSVHTYMTRILYQQRSKFEPLWNTLVIGGFTEGETYLGYVDKIGVAYQDATVATGYGAYIALPIMRAALEENPNMTVAEGKALLVRCLKVMYYRDARSLNKYVMATSTASGLQIDEPVSADTNWDVADFVQGYN